MTLPKATICCKKACDWVAEDEPYHTGYWICSNCDSTYNSEENFRKTLDEVLNKYKNLFKRLADR